MKMYRIQDNDKEKTRMTIEGKNAIVNSGPLNVSAEYPDHALYFGSRKNAFEIDVIIFEVEDGFYARLKAALVKQERKKADQASFNDPSTPGFKIEIPKEGAILENFKKAILPGTGKTVRAAEFAASESKGRFNKTAVQALAATFKKAFTKEAAKFDKIIDTDVNGDTPEDDDIWKDHNEKLWSLFNKLYAATLKSGT